MLLDLFDGKKLRRAGAWALYMVAVLFLQNMVFSNISILGVKTLFLPAACVLAGMLEGGVFGAVFGLVCGFFGDMSFAENTVLFTVIFAAAGFFGGFAATFLFNKKFWSYLLLATLSMLLTGLCQAVFAAIASGSSLWPLLPTALLQTLWSIPVAAALYPPARKISDRFSGLPQRKDIK